MLGGMNWLRPALLIAAFAGLGVLSGPAMATPGYTGHRLYALAPGYNSGTLVPFDIGPGGQLQERDDQQVSVPGNSTGLLVDREARSVFVSSSDVYDNDDNAIPGVIEVFTVGADGSLTLAQTVPSSSFAMALAPDGSLYAQQMDGEIDSYPVQPDGTLGAERTFYSFSQPATMFAVSPDGASLYMDGQNGLWFEWTIEPDFTLASLPPGQWGPPGPQCYSPFIGIAVGRSNVDLACSYGGGFTMTPGPDGEMTAVTGTFTGPGGWNGDAEDAHGRGLYAASGVPSVYEFERQADGSLAPFAIPSVSSPHQIQALAADPDGTALTAVASGYLETYAIAADGSLSAGPTATTPIAMSAPAYIAYAPQVAPVAAFGSTQTADGSTSFDARSSHAFEGRTIARYDWSFGDGTTLADGGPTPSHAYPQAGDYTATLTVTDSAGCSVAGTFNGSMALCSGGTGAAATHAVHVAAAAPVEVAAPTGATAPAGGGVTEPPVQLEPAPPTAATAALNKSGKKLLLSWAKPGSEPASGSTVYLIAWSTLHSAQGPGDPNMHHLRVKGKTHILMRTSPHTTLHFAVYAYGADGSLTRATKTTVRVPG